MPEDTLHTDGQALIDRFMGSAIGTFVGDALGEPVEGWSHQAIESRFGLLDKIVREEGRYTDDTQMMIGILETLRERRTFDPAWCAQRFKENFDPTRGYGRRIFGVVDRIKQGLPWDQVGTDSYGNGGAMRIAPIGCFYFHDLEALKKNALLSARITHNHPEALAGAVAQATAVGLAVRFGLFNTRIDPENYLDSISGQVQDVDRRFAEYLQHLKLICRGFAPAARDSFCELIEAIRGRYQLTLRAIESVPAAIGAFVLTTTFKEALILAVNLGGDTDTIGAMAGATAGAYYGYGQIPRSWINPLENQRKGRDYVVDCARAMASAWHDSAVLSARDKKYEKS